MQDEEKCNGKGKSADVHKEVQVAGNTTSKGKEKISKKRSCSDQKLVHVNRMYNLIS